MNFYFDFFSLLFRTFAGADPGFLDRGFDLLRTSFHTGVFLGPEYFNNILGSNSHIKGTCIAATLNRTDLWFGVYCLLKVCGGVILYQSYLR